MTRVKICGITNSRDARAAAFYGADSIGLNFYPGSPRFVSIAQAARICREIPGEVCKVGVFVNESPGLIAETAGSLGLEAVQLHGDESETYIGLLKDISDVKVIRAFRVKAGEGIENLNRTCADALLLDTHSEGKYGGTGTTFEWENAAGIGRSFGEFYLAGGLNCENVMRAIRQTEPDYVDVSSGVEASPGSKDKKAMAEFIARAKWASAKGLADRTDVSPVQRLLGEDPAGTLTGLDELNRSLKDRMTEYRELRSMLSRVEEGFALFVKDRCGFEKSGIEWPVMLARRSKGDQRLALFTFLSILAAYLSQRGSDAENEI